MLDRTLAVAGSFEEMGTYSIQAMVAQKPWIGFESFEARKARHRTVNHRECHSMVQGDHRVVFYPQEEPVQLEDLRPISLRDIRRLVVHGRDRRL